MVTKSEPRSSTTPTAVAPVPHGDESTEPIGTLRGAGVGVDVRRAGRVVVGGILVTLGALAVVFFVAGWQKNAQITRLHQHGVPVVVTVTGCTGLLGGSGSNPVGYACRGTFAVDGHRYQEAIPGTALYRPGATLRALTVVSDPVLVTPVRMAALEHPSENVYVLPAVLAVVLVLIAVAVAVALRRRRTEG